MKKSEFIPPYIKAKLFNHHNEKSLTILLTEIERLENRIMSLELKINSIQKLNIETIDFIPPSTKAKLFYEKNFEILLCEIDRLEYRVRSLEIKIENINFITNSIGPCSPDPFLDFDLK